MTNNKELILIHTSMSDVRIDHPVNVILTPQFYTIKREPLPVKYAYQAKKIAPSLFDGLLVNDVMYEYAVFKEEENWVFVAYDMAEIATFLESKGLDDENVAKIYFAQQSLEHFAEGTLALGEHDALTVIDNTVVVIPRVVLAEDQYPSLRISNAFTPKTSGIKLKTLKETKTLISQTQALSLAAIFMLFAGMFGVEGSRYSGDAQQETEEMNAIYEEHPYLKSSYTREDVIDKYTLMDKAERRKRDAIKACSGMIFKGVTLTELRVDEKSFTGIFNCSSAEVASRVKNVAKKSKDNFFTIKGETTLQLEGKL